MILPGHIAGGYLAATAVLALSHAPLSSAEATALLTIGTLAGEAPDIDILFFFLHHRYSRNASKRTNHRSFFTHLPAFWLLLSLAIAAAGWFAGSVFTELLGWMILAGSWTHFFLDSFEYGIVWLWPFSDRRFAMRQIEEPHVEAPQGTVAYYVEHVGKIWNKRITFVLEVILVIVTAWVILAR